MYLKILDCKGLQRALRPIQFYCLRSLSRLHDQNIHRANDDGCDGDCDDVLYD